MTNHNEWLQRAIFHRRTRAGQVIGVAHSPVHVGLFAAYEAAHRELPSASVVRDLYNFLAGEPRNETSQQWEKENV